MNRTNARLRCLVAVLAAVPVWPQVPGLSPPPPVPPPADPIGRSTPRGAVLGFLKAAQQDRWSLASEYLDVARHDAAALKLAQQLKAVLDFGLMENLDRVSDRPDGSTSESPARDRVSVGAVRNVEIWLTRREAPGSPPLWLFSRDTLARIPQLYAETSDHWIETRLPEPLITTRFLTLALWQWIALLLAIPLVFALAWPVHRLLLAIVSPLLARLTKEGEPIPAQMLAGPIRLFVAATIMRAFSFGAVPLLVRQFWIRAAIMLAIVSLAWLTMRLSDITSRLIETHLLRIGRASSLSVLHLGRRLFKATVVAGAVVALIGSTGRDTTTLIAGLGIGGIAIAFAAQKTLENLLGGVMLITDQPFRVGDAVRVDNRIGTVEDVGLRSTRLRLMENSVLSVPNGILAAVNIENLTARQKILFRHTVGVRYETTPEQLRFLLAELRKLLFSHPMVETESARARFVLFGPSSLDIELFAYILTGNFPIFLQVQEDLLLRTMETIRSAGTGIAFPSRTIYMGKDEGLDAERVQRAQHSVQRWRQNRELPFPEYPDDVIQRMKRTIDYPPDGSAASGA